MENSVKNILKNFLTGDGKLTQFPAKRKMKGYALYYLAGKFETGKVYTETEINNVLLSWHTFADPATLRRELYNYHFLDRSLDGRTYCLSSEPPSLEQILSK